MFSVLFRTISCIIDLPNILFVFFYTVPSALMAMRIACLFFHILPIPIPRYLYFSVLFSVFIRSKLDNSRLLIHGSGPHSGNLHTASPTIFTKQKLTNWKPVSEEQVTKLIKNPSNASYKNDPLPTKPLKDYLQEQLIPIICHIVNCSLESGVFPKHYKIALVKPLLKKETLHSNVLKNYRPVSNLTYVSNLLEKVGAEQLTDHLQKHDLLDTFQSAYKPNYSTETALSKVGNDILRALDNKQCLFLTLFDLSAAYDTIDHGIQLLTFK